MDRISRGDKRKRRNDLSTTIDDEQRPWKYARWSFSLVGREGSNVQRGRIFDEVKRARKEKRRREEENVVEGDVERSGQATSEEGHCSEDGSARGRGDGRGWWRVEAGGLREREGEGEGEGRGGEAKTPRERENNALKQQQAATTTLIGHFVHLFDLFKLWDN